MNDIYCKSPLKGPGIVSRANSGLAHRNKAGHCPRQQGLGPNTHHTHTRTSEAGDSGGVGSRRSPDRCLNSEVGWLRPRPRSIPHVVYGDVMYLLLYHVSTAHTPPPLPPHSPQMGERVVWQDLHLLRPLLFVVIRSHILP